jgi:hypothetical protein
MPRKGVTEAWVTGTHAERTRTKSLERRFSAASSGGFRRRRSTDVKIAVAM